MDEVITFATRTIKAGNVGELCVNKQMKEMDFLLSLLEKQLPYWRTIYFFSCTLIDLATNVITFNPLDASFSLGTQKIIFLKCSQKLKMPLREIFPKASLFKPF